MLKTPVLAAVLCGIVLTAPAGAQWPGFASARETPLRLPPAPKLVALSGAWVFDKTETAIYGQYCNGTGQIATPSSGSTVMAALGNLPYADKLFSLVGKKPKPVAKPKAVAGEVTLKVAGFREFSVVVAVLAPGQSSRLTIQRDTETVVENLAMRRGRLYPVVLSIADAQALTLATTDAGNTLFCSPELRRVGRS